MTKDFRPEKKKRLYKGRIKGYDVTDQVSSVSSLFTKILIEQSMRHVVGLHPRQVSDQNVSRLRVSPIYCMGVRVSRVQWWSKTASVQSRSWTR